MKISISNKRLDHKPDTPQEKGLYFKDLLFKTGNFHSSSIKEIVGGGWTITYLFKDDVFGRSNHYMKDNYVGTQFICVDIDKCDLSPEDFVERIKYRPSVIHTTFSNLTERKEGKYCYHLLYFFDDVIPGEDNFRVVFDKLTEDYKEYVDDCARDCHRVMFTSNSVLPNYQYEEYDMTYHLNDFISYEYDDINQFFKGDDESKSNDWEKTVSYDKSYSSHYNISRETNISQKKDVDNTFDLDVEFLNDLYTMNRSCFIGKYSTTYPYITETVMENDRFENGYVDLRGEEYYVVPSAQYRWDHKNNKPHVPKVQIGIRTKMLWLDTLCFMKIVPGITKEYLVYLLVTEVFRNFDNTDRQMTNKFIIDKCKEVWNNMDNLNIKPVRKSFRIDKKYWIKKGYKDWLEVSRIIRRQMRCEDFGEYYDFSMTVEDNVKEMRNNNVKTTKRTLVRWLEENGFPYELEKDRRDRMIVQLYEEDRTRSSREIEKLCLNSGVKVSYRTIQKVVGNIDL